MSVFKKASALFAAACMAVAFTGCSDTTYGLVVDDYTVPAGVYIYYANSAYNSAVSQMAEENSELDTTDRKAIQNAAKTAMLEGKDVKTWIQDKTTELCVNFVAVEKKFDELGLELEAETQAYLDSMTDYYWEMYQDTMEDNGISEDSFKRVMASSFKSEMVFTYYYGVDGEMGVKEEDLRTYYADHTMRSQYVKFDLLDAEGNAMDDAAKSDMMKTVKAYETQVEVAYRDGGVSAVMAEMNKVQEEYTASLTEDADSETETEEPTTEEPTAEAETDTLTEDGTAEEETDTDSEENSEEETVSYTNERILNVIDENEYEEGETIPYTPTEKVYKALMNTAEYGEPFIVEEEDAYYLCVRYDIADRMTEEDLWNENQIYSVEMTLYNEDFDAMIQEWSDVLTVTKNEAAYKRYDPFKYLLDM